MQTTFLSTGALAIAANVPENTIKSWKLRGHFQEGTHFIKSGGRLDWLPAAVDRCRELAKTGPLQPLQPLQQEDTAVIDDLVAEFNVAMQPLANKVAHARLQARWEALVLEAEQAALQRVLALARQGETDLAQYGFTDPWLVVGAIPTTQAALTGGKEGRE